MTGSPLLFDLDGTLSDNFTGIAACIRHALGRMGVAAPGDDILRGYVGPPLRRSFARLLQTTDHERIETAIGHYRERFSTIGWQENVVYPDIAEVLAELRAQGARLFVCTAKPQVYAQRIVAHLGFAPHFEGVYGADLDGRLDDKAALMAHLLAHERIDPACAVMIGDRHHDVVAARGNAVRSIGVLWGYGSADELAGADSLVAAPRALPAAVRALLDARAPTDAASPRP